MEEEEEDTGLGLAALLEFWRSVAVAVAAADVGRKSMLSRGFHTGEPVLVNERILLLYV